MFSSVGVLGLGVLVMSLVRVSVLCRLRLKFCVLIGCMVCVVLLINIVCGLISCVVVM